MKILNDNNVIRITSDDAEIQAVFVVSHKKLQRLLTTAKPASVSILEVHHLRVFLRSNNGAVVICSRE